MGFLDRIAGRFDELVAGESDTQLQSREEIELARALADRGSLDDAVAALGRAVDLDASNAEAWSGMGEVLGALGRFEPARDAFRRALTLTLTPERRARAQSALGRLYAGAGQTGKAIRELRKAAGALPDDVDTLTALGRALITADDAAEGEGSEWLARAARLPGGDPHLLLEAAQARSKTDAAAGERLLREATARAPGDARLRAALARHLASVGDLAAALREAATAVGALPEDPGVWGALREVQAAAANYPAAIEAARREAGAGRAPIFSSWLALALGAQDRLLVEEALRHGHDGDPGWREARALLDGTLNEGGLAALARLAPDTPARTFTIQALAPPPVPAGNIYALLAWAAALAERQPALLPLAVPMARAVEAFDRPLLVAVMGEFNAGKSSFVNALAGAAIAPVGVTPTTATINILRFGPGGGRAVYHDGRVRELGSDAVGAFLGALDDDDAAAIRQVEIFAPVEALRRVEIVDTPGLNSLRAAHEKVARDFLVEADAIVWVFAAGQAAKATERDALGLAHAAGKRVLGVLNKVDRATPDEVAAVVRHVQAEMGDLVERVVPLSARAALAARLRGDQPAVESAGLPAVESALESDFFGQARELKRATAILALGRFVGEARAALRAPPPPGEIAPQAASPAVASPQAEEQDLEQDLEQDIGQDLRSALAGERVALRARLDAAFRSAAFEVRDFVRPRAWLFGEHTADPEDERFLRELLDDGVVAATATTRAALLGAMPPAGPSPDTRTTELLAAIEDAVERFRAYARGIIEGAAAVFFRVDLPHIRLDLAAIHGALGRWSPEPEESLFRPLERAVDAFVARCRADGAERERSREIAAAIMQEHVLAPLDALAEEITALAQASAQAPPR